MFTLVDHLTAFKEYHDMATARPGTRPAAAPSTALVDFGSDAQFIGGFGIPEGRFALWFDVMMHRFTKKDGTPGRGPENLKIRVSAYPIDENGVSLLEKDEEPKYGYYGLGGKAHLSFAPEPTLGKSLVPIPGGVASSFNDQTNWAMFRAALRNCGMPDKFFTNDLTVLDGMWAMMHHVPEPEGRKALRGGRTAEVEKDPDEEDRGPQTVAVPREVVDGGRPWDGQAGGVMEAAAAPKAAKPNGKPVTARPAAAPAAAAARPAARPVAAAPAPAAEEAGEEDVATASTNAIAAFFEEKDAKGNFKNAKGAAKAMLRTYVFRVVSETVSAEMGQAVLDAFFTDEAVLGSILGQFGYVIDGGMIKAQA